jgi:hypothetical protein
MVVGTSITSVAVPEGCRPRVVVTATSHSPFHRLVMSTARPLCTRTPGDPRPHWCPHSREPPAPLGHRLLAFPGVSPAADLLLWMCDPRVVHHPPLKARLVGSGLYQAWLASVVILCLFEGAVVWLLLSAGGSGYQGSGWGQQSSHQSYGPPPPGYGGLPRGGSYGSSHGYDGFTTSAPQPHHGYPPASFYEDPYAVPPPHDHRGVTDPYSGGYGYGPSPHTQPDRHYGYSARPERVPPPQMMPQQADPWQERHMRQAPSSGPYGGHSGGRGGYGAREPRESRESRGEYGGHSSYREGPAPSSYGDAPPSRGERYVTGFAVLFVVVEACWSVVYWWCSRPPRGDGSQTHASLLAELKASLGKVRCFVTAVVVSFFGGRYVVFSCADRVMISRWRTLVVACTCWPRISTDLGSFNSNWKRTTSP